MSAHPFAVDERVCIRLSNGTIKQGVVESMDERMVQIYWSDGTNGLLYFDGSTLADANRLEPMRSACCETALTEKHCSGCGGVA